MFENKKLLVIAIAVVMFGFLIMPVSAIGVTQTIVATQSGSGNTQILINYNSGGDATQSINAGQVGNNNYQFLMNYKPVGSTITQTITNYQTGNFNRYVRINRVG